MENQQSLKPTISWV